MLLEHERDYVLGMDAFIMECTRTRSLLRFWHGCSQARMHSNTNGSIAWPWVLSSSSALEHERCDGLCMDALATVSSWNTNVIMVWTWMLPTSSALEYDPSLSAVEHACYDGSGMDALIIECTRTRTLIWFGHGCSGNRMLLETKRESGCSSP